MYILRSDNLQSIYEVCVVLVFNTMVNISIAYMYDRLLEKITSHHCYVKPVTLFYSLFRYEEIKTLQFIWDIALQKSADVGHGFLVCSEALCISTVWPASCHWSWSQRQKNKLCFCWATLFYLSCPCGRDEVTNHAFLLENCFYLLFSCCDG